MAIETGFRESRARAWRNESNPANGHDLPRRNCYIARGERAALTESGMIQAEKLVGTWRRFGAVGPVYEIIQAGRQLPNGDRMMRIRVIESGEEAEYRLLEILDDPKER
jgi:hypothetical protein